MDRPRVAVLLTGGTIGSAGHDDMDRLDYVDLGNVLSDEEVLPLYRLPDGVDVEMRRFARIPSTAADFAFWARLRATIIEIVVQDPSVSGIVVAHGTATLEETAFFLHMTLPCPVPVVFVGAQRPPTAVGSDAQINLQSAIRVAASPDARGHGVLVVLDDRILSARDVMKSSNHALDAFQPRAFGTLGDVDPYGGVWFQRKDLRRHTTESRFRHLLNDFDGEPARVEIVPVWAGIGPDVLRRAVDAGAAGIVMSSLPPSMNPPAVEDEIDRVVAEGVAVVQSSRAPLGRVAQRHDFDRRGLIASDTLSPQAARILLMLCLTAGLGREDIGEVFRGH